MSLDEIAESLGFEVLTTNLPMAVAGPPFARPWKSSTGWYVIPARVAAGGTGVKPTDFQRYCTRLLALGDLSDREHAFALLVVLDTGFAPNAYATASRRWAGCLRIISLPHLVALARLRNTGVLEHDDVVRLLRPPDPAIDPVVHLIDRCVSAAEDRAGVQTGSGDAYWLAQIEYKDHAALTGMLQSVIGKRQLLPLSDSGSVPACIGVGDWICFYVVGRGVVGRARVASTPEKPLIRLVRDAERYPWICRLDAPVLYLENPVGPLPFDEGPNGAANEDRLLTSFALMRLQRREFQRLTQEMPDPAALSQPTQQRAT
jgi:hypothetical protein